jgi:uncharacterized protein (TIGR01244 family)
MRSILAGAIILTGSLFLFGMGDESIPNLYQPRYMIYTSGQPSIFGMSELSEMGVKSVINVLPDKECVPGEAAIVNANQMEYYAVPFDPQSLSIDTVYEFAELLAVVEKPVLIHCSTGNHAGGMWFAYRVLYEKAPLAQGLKEGRTIGMQRAMEDAVFQFIVTNQTTQTAP